MEMEILVVLLHEYKMVISGLSEDLLHWYSDIESISTV